MLVKTKIGTEDGSSIGSRGVPNSVPLDELFGFSVGSKSSRGVKYYSMVIDIVLSPI